jgi:drug/metabolite transporter (DMT)-like permease
LPGIFRSKNIFKNPPGFVFVAAALLVTFLWSTSFIIIKRGLNEIPPLTYAGLRYSIAFVCLLPFVFTKSKIEEIKSINHKDWIKLITLGFLFYTFTQGTQFFGLSLLPAVTVSLLLNFTPIVVAVMGIFLLSEKPTPRQWLGAALFIAGILTYFYPSDFSGGKTLGIIVMIIGVLANSGSAILGRSINRGSKYSAITITVISMGIGSSFMLASGIIFQGLPSISTTTFFYLLWLAIVNTAFAFTLWNFSLRHLSAMESSIINGTMLIQIALLAWIFLDESISIYEGVGMFIAAIGAVLVQLKRKKVL